MVDVDDPELGWCRTAARSALARRWRNRTERPLASLGQMRSAGIARAWPRVVMWFHAPVQLQCKADRALRRIKAAEPIRAKPGAVHGGATRHPLPRDRAGGAERRHPSRRGPRGRFLLL